MYEKLKEFLDSITIISDEDWLLLAPELKLKEYSKNDYYLFAGEIERQIGFILKGSFRWYYINPEGEEINFHFFFENSFIVEFQSYLSEKPGRMYIQAMEDSSVILLPQKEKLEQFYSKSHSLEHLGRLVTENVYLETAERVKDFLYNTPEERYKNLLERHPDIFQRVSLANISSYLGIKPQSLSRIRKRILKSKN